MIRSDRMAAVDANAAALGVPQRQLMESSGNAVAREVKAVAESNERVVIVAGRGNNGGDGFVAARFLDEYDVSVLLLGQADDIGTHIARANWDALENLEFDAREVTDSTEFALSDCDVVVDAMLGTGATGALREPEATAARAINEATATVVSVDVPTGVNADTGETNGVAVEADRVVTFHDAKPGLVDLDADVTVADIGIPDAAELFVGPGDVRRAPRDPESHKGEHGDIVVVGGGPYTGAPALSAQAALRAGADLAQVACPSSIADEVQGYSENLIVRPLDGTMLTTDHVDYLLDITDGHTVVIGPGLGQEDETLAAVSEFLTAFDGTAIVDADALSVVPEVKTEASLVCTPHQGELKEMGGPVADDWRERMERAAEFADELGQVLLVKGAHDIVTDGETTRVSRTGNPGMAVGGTGDVLAGTTAALAATLDPVTAAAVGAYVNGRAGDLAAEENGYGMLATDVLTRLPAAMWGTDE